LCLDTLALATRPVLNDWTKRDPLGPAEELKFLEGLVAKTKISDSRLAEYVNERIRALQEQLKKAENP
jgi:hypothetical protein